MHLFELPQLVLEGGKHALEGAEKPLGIGTIAIARAYFADKQMLAHDDFAGPRHAILCQGVIVRKQRAAHARLLPYRREHLWASLSHQRLRKSLPMMEKVSYHRRDASTLKWGGQALSRLPPVLTDAAMQSKSLLFQAYARECENKAEAVQDLALKNLYRDLASQWRELGGIARNLSLDKQKAQQFYETQSFDAGASR